MIQKNWTFYFHSKIFLLCTWVLTHFKSKINYTVCYGDIPYHTPKMDSSNLNIFSELSSLVETTSCSLRDIWQTDCKPSTASTPFVWLSFSANTITFTCHPLFELFFHRSYMKTTTQSIAFGIEHSILILLACLMA